MLFDEAFYIATVKFVSLFRVTVFPNIETE